MREIRFGGPVGPTRDCLRGRGSRELYQEGSWGSFLYFVRSVRSYVRGRLDPLRDPQIHSKLAREASRPPSHHPPGRRPTAAAWTLLGGGAQEGGFLHFVRAVPSGGLPWFPLDPAVLRGCSDRPPGLRQGDWNTLRVSPPPRPPNFNVEAGNGQRQGQNKGEHVAPQHCPARCNEQH